MKEKGNIKASKSYWFQAATGSWVAPILAIFSILITSSYRKENFRAEILITYFCYGIILFGLALGIITLISKKWKGKGEIQKPMVVGITLNTIAIIVAAFCFMGSESLKMDLGTVEIRKTLKNGIPVTLTMFKLNKDKGELVVIDCPDRSRKSSIAQGFKAAGCKAGVNGGYFTKAFQPLGLFVIDGKEINPIRTVDPSSAVVSISFKGKVSINQVTKYQPDLKGVKYAFQAGPFLVKPGGKPGIEKQDEKPYRRTVLALTKSGEVMLLVTDPITWYDLGEILLDKDAMGFDIERALNLDGGPSTGFYAETENGEIEIKAKWPVRNLVGVKAK